MSTINTVNSGGRYDTQCAAIYEEYRRKSHLVTHTEAQYEKAILGGYSWGVIHGSGGGPRSDPAIEFSKKTFELVSHWIFPISELSYQREGGSKSGTLFAAVGLFNVYGLDKQFIQANVHWPRWSQPERRDTYLDGIKHLVEFISEKAPKAHKRITGDWNRDLRKVGVRNHLEKLMKLLNLTCDWNYPLPTNGTFGKKLYDGSFISPGITNIDTFLLPDNKESDHRPYGSKLSLFA